MTTDRRWTTPEQLALGKKLIHCQDKLIATLGLAIHRGISNQNYGLVIKLLGTIEHDAQILERTAQDLIGQLPRRKGNIPKWFNQAEDILYLALQTQREIGQIRQELIGNYWKLINTRLTKCYDKSRKLQREFINLLPQDDRVESDYAGTMSQLLDTLEMGETTENQSGHRWRKNR